MGSLVVVTMHGLPDNADAQVSLARVPSVDTTARSVVVHRGRCCGTRFWLMLMVQYGESCLVMVTLNDGWAWLLWSRASHYASDWSWFRMFDYGGIHKSCVLSIPQVMESINFQGSAMDTKMLTCPLFRVLRLWGCHWCLRGWFIDVISLVLVCFSDV